MLILRPLILLLILFPGMFYCLPCDYAWGENEAAVIAQLDASLETPQVKQYRNSPEQIAGETQKTEALATEPAPPESSADSETKHAIAAPEASNPVAVSAVNKSLSLFSERIKARFSLYLERSGKYIDLMKDVFRKKNMPEDIVFLSLIESGFNPNAYSVARAVGPWQFIASTAKRYGLKIDWWKDERKDPVKSTTAAADYLSDLHDMFGSWSLAMAAYNAGEGRILKALNRTRSDDYWTLLNTSQIRTETKEYVPRFIAAGMIAANPKEYGFEGLEYHAPFAFDEVTLNSPVDLDIAAGCAEVAVNVIKELNPELRRWSTPPNVASYTLRIPAGKKKAFMENISKIPMDERFTITIYTVKKGDTLKGVAKNAGVPLNVVLELNDGIRIIKAGEKIYIPPKDKFHMDRDDKTPVKKAVYKKPRKKKHQKTLVTALNRKNNYVND